MAKINAPVRGMERENLSKVVFFFAKINAPVSMFFKNLDHFWGTFAKKKIFFPPER